MNDRLCCLTPAYGAMVHALPNDARQLNGFAEELIIQTVIPFFKQPQVKPVTDKQFNQWFNTLNGLDDLGGLDDLDGLKKKLKKVAKKVVTAHKKVGKALTSKKLARPFAYAIGAATGTIGLVAKADQMRNKVRAQRAQAKANEPQAQEPVVQEQAEPVYQEPVIQNMLQQSFAPQPQVQAPLFVAPTPKPQTPQPIYQAPSPIQYTQPVQRIEQPEQQEQGRIVGLNTQGIMESFKANPLPWMVGAGVVVLLIARK